MQPCPTNPCLQSNNCPQPVPTVRLDPTTRMGASCQGHEKKDLLQDGIPLFVNQLFYPSE